MNRKKICPYRVSNLHQWCSQRHRRHGQSTACVTRFNRRRDVTSLTTSCVHRQNTGISFWYPETLTSFWYRWDIKMTSLWGISFWCPGMTSLGYLTGCHKDISEISFWYLWDINNISFRKISFWCPGMTSLEYLMGYHFDILLDVMQTSPRHYWDIY